MLISENRGVKRSVQTNITSSYIPSELVPVYCSNPNGKGQTIVIIDAFVYNNLAGDYSTFCRKFGYTTSVLNIHNMGTRLNTVRDDWSVEMCLDTQWSTVFAPKATIWIVNATSDSTSDLYNALQYAVTILKPNVVSMSWGMPESTGSFNQSI